MKRLTITITNGGMKIQIENLTVPEIQDILEKINELPDNDTNTVNATLTIKTN